MIKTYKLHSKSHNGFNEDLTVWFFNAFSLKHPTRAQKFQYSSLPSSEKLHDAATQPAEGELEPSEKGATLQRHQRASDRLSL